MTASPERPTVMTRAVDRLRRRVSDLGWGGALLLATLLVAGLPFAALAQPPADPVITIINTGSGGLAIVADTSGRSIVLGGSAGRTAATAHLDRHLPPWERRLGLLLVPPPHAAALPGALEVLERRAVGRASLLGLAARPQPALDAWQARRPAPPVVGRAAVDLGAETRLLLETGPDPAAGAAVALVERGSISLLLLFGEGGSLAAEAVARGTLPAPVAVARLTPGATPPAGLRPALVIALDEREAAATGPRTLGLAAGEAVRVVLRADRLTVQGKPVRPAIEP